MRLAFIECATPRMRLMRPSSVRLTGGSSLMTGTLTVTSPPPCALAVCVRGLDMIPDFDLQTSDVALTQRLKVDVERHKPDISIILTTDVPLCRRYQFNSSDSSTRHGW